MIIRLRSPILSLIVAHYHQDRRATGGAAAWRLNDIS